MLVALPDIQTTNRPDSRRPEPGRPATRQSGSRHRARSGFRSRFLRECRSDYSVTASYRSCVCERGSTGSPGNERVLQAAWRRLSEGSRVKGRDGSTYVVLYPGRPVDGPGPDFRDAVLRGPDGALMRGDVEIHVRPSGWRAHRHHIDPRYNGVAFHVTGSPGLSGSGEGADVSWPDINPARTQLGRPMHLLVIGRQSPGSFDESEAPTPGSATGQFLGLTPELVDPDALASAGEQRFLGKSAGLSIALRGQGGDQAAWAAVLDCLGFSRNRRAFRQVAARLPWPVLSAAFDSGGDATALLMWAGGFGPKPLELRNSRSADHTGGVPPVWVMGGRPDNSPKRRLAAAAVLAERWWKDGPLNTMIDIVRATSGPTDMIEAIRVNPPPTSVKGNGARALIGEGRAREIVVNAVLPLVHGWSLMADRWDVTEKAFRLYRDHSKFPANVVTRKMTRVLESRGSDLKIKDAREQQGLILMYRAMTAGPLCVPPSENPDI
ncbi:MAG: DUF2851 family protein [Dehalococcoidia bacterium]